MKLKLELFIAWRYLKSKKQESFISVVALFSLIGTALGVAALIAVMSVMAGVRDEWSRMLIGASGDINIYSRFSDGLDDYAILAKKISINNQINSIVPIIEKQALISAFESNIGVQVKGISKENLLKKDVIAGKISYGDINNFRDNGIIIGQTLANNLGITIGDSVKLVSPQINSTLIGNIPRVKTCRIAAIFNAGTPDLDNYIVFMPIDLAQIYYNFPDKITLLELNIKDSTKSEQIAEELRTLLPEKYRIVDWKHKNASLMNALQVEKTAMFLILTLIMIVAAFNIISGLIMLVKDKTPDIAILRTMGASRSMIIRIFLICGSSIGIIGTLIGAILGISFATNIENIRIFLQSITGVTLFDPLVYFLSFLPAKIAADDVGLIVTMSLSISIIATIYPAYKAAKLNPAIILK